MTLATRLTVLEQRILPPATAPASVLDFDFDAYRAQWQELATKTPEELAALCADALAAAAWPALVPGREPFDWREYTMIFYEVAAGTPHNWHELVEEAGR